MVGGSDITMLSDVSLMSLFAQAIAWQNFADSIATEAEIREASFSEQMSLTEANVLINTWSAAPVITGARGAQRVEFRAAVAKANTETSPEVISAREMYFKAKAARKRAQTVRDNSERVAQLLSRELTRRIGREPIDRRAGRYIT